MLYSGETEEEKYYRGANVVLAPARLMGEIKLLLCVILYGILYTPYYLYNQSGWRFGVGEHGVERRQAQIAPIESVLSEDTGYQTHQLYQLDMRRRARGLDWDVQNSRWEGATLPVDHNTFWDNMGLAQRVPANLTISMVSKDLKPIDVPDIYWPQQFPDKFDGDPCDYKLNYTHTSWDLRPTEWLSLKSSRWQNALTLAAYDTGALRVILTELKLGMAPDIKTHNPCQADFGLVKDTSRSLYNSWDNVSKSIVLPDAPVVIVQEYQNGIIGACIASHCNEKTLHPFTTKYGDLKDDEPYIGKEGEEVEAYLMKTSTESFWLQEAHKNGVYDDTTISQWVALLFDRQHQAEEDAKYNFNRGNPSAKWTFLSLK